MKLHGLLKWETDENPIKIFSKWSLIENDWIERNILIANSVPVPCITRFDNKN